MCKACLCGPGDTEPCSMGGIAECGLSVDTKASPRRAAIDKAQEELRQEYDVREERRRELEFLEKGGNPLDFKLGHVASLSVQSTSVTDHITEQNVISEAKGSFAFAASPHGDSVESSGKPGSSSHRDANTADNLMLLDGDTSNIGGDKNAKRGTKRTNAAQPESNAKEAEDSGLFRLGAKNQAYARRRSKSSRENANTLSVGSLPVSPLSSQRKDAKEVIQESKIEDHGVSSVGNAKPISPNRKNTLKIVSLDDHVAMETNSVQAIHEGNQAAKHVTTNGRDGMQTPEILPDSVTDNSQLIGGGLVATAAASADVIPKEDASRATSSFPSTCNGILREAHTAEKAGNDCSNKSMAVVIADDTSSKSAVPYSEVETASSNENEVDLTCADLTKTVDEDPVKDKTSVSVKVAEMSDEVLSNVIPYDKNDKKVSQLEASCMPIVIDGSSTSIHPELEISNSICVKDEIEVCNNMVDAQKDTGHLATSDHDKVNKEPGSDLGRNDCSADFNFGDKLASVTVAPALLTNTVPNSMSSMNLDNDVRQPSENKTNMAKKECEDTTVAKKECEDTVAAKKEHEDSILRRAQFIEVSINRAGERSPCNISLEKKPKSQWEFVLEEMAWMANDFMQERLWKSAAAAQMCYWIASSGRATFKEANIRRKQKSVARTLAKGIIKFWCSAETSRATCGEIPKERQVVESIGLEETKLSAVKSEKEQVEGSLEQEKSRRSHQSPIQSYALRFLEYNRNVSECLFLAEAPPTPDRLNDFGILKVPDQLSEENLFYVVAPGAMRAYRESVECLSVYNKKINHPGHNGDYEPSTTGSAADVHRGNAYEDDDGDTCTYLLPGTYDGGLTSKLSHKKKQLMQQRMNGTRPYDIGPDMPYDPYLESKSGNQPFLSNGKRPSDFFSIPTKRIRTAARQRVVSPHPTGVAGTTAFASKTDASSGDTNSCQDDQSSLHGGSFSRKNMDVESTVDFDRQLLYNGSEVPTKSKKKKKSKHLGYKTPQSVTESCTLIAGKGIACDPRPQVDLIAQYEQKDYLKKRSEAPQFDSNGNIVMNGQHALKKPKLMNQAPDVSLEALTPVGPMASPVASQMSNMINPTKIIKIITNRDRGRKNKALKMTVGHSGPGSPWSNFEDQALVVLVHDMGQNWELVSDALNSIIQLKCIYRRPNECKDRHKLLTEKSSGDGADSADDSGSSQHYQSTLPGIPKGSARQLFQRLQGPFEEETLKTHFENIIFLGQKIHPSRIKGESQELKQINSLHTSHAHGLSQICPPGVILTPLDLCDTMTPNPDALSIGYPGSHASGLMLPNHHSSIGPTLPSSNLNPRLPGPPSMVLGSTLPSPATSNAPSRDAQRYGAPRPISVQGDEQQRIQYNQMLNSRNLQQPGGSVPGVLPAGVDRGVRMMPGAHGMGMMTGLNRGAPIARPGFPRLGSSGILNMASSGNMVPSNGQGMQNTSNVHPGTIPNHGNTMLRPRDPMQMIRPGQNMEEHRQMMMQEFQMQVSQGNSQAIHFSGTPFSNVGASSPGQSFPVQQSQSHPMPQQSHMLGNAHHSHIQGTNQYAMRLAKERHIQQCMMSQQQHPLSGASAMPTVQNGSHMQQQSQGSTSSAILSSQPQHKQQHPAQSPLDSSVLPNQPVNTSHKQKKQQGQQQSRQNQQQRNQGSQQAKLMKSLGRGNMMHQSPPVDGTQPSGISTTSKKQVSDKNLIQQGPGYFAGNKGLVPSVLQPGNQPKIYAPQMPQSPMQTPDIGNQGSMQGSPNHTMLASQQAPLHSHSPLATQQQQQQQPQRYMNPSHNNIQRLMMQQNHHMNTDGRIELPVDQAQHNHAIPSTSVARSTDSGSPGGVSSINQRKQESCNDPTAVTSTSQLASSPQDTFVGNETMLSVCSQGILQRQMSGGMPVHGHGVGGHRQQQQSRQQHQSQQQRPPVQGSVYSHSSNSGPA